MASAEKPIIVIKKKGGHGGHHGGAWKIAYADFVTAMMAFFMVMWLVNSSDSVTKKAIASYFKRPGVFHAGSGTPLEIGGAGILPDAFAPTREDERVDDGAVQGLPVKKGNEQGPPAIGPDAKKVTGAVVGGVDHPTEGGNPMLDKRFITKQKEAFENISNQLKQMMLTTPEFQALLGAVDVQLDANGLTIDIMDTEKASMFSSGSSMILPSAYPAFEKLGAIIAKVPNEIEILGHTDGKPFSARTNGYSNWELSTDRSNSARRMLEAFGVAPDRIVSVVGKADTELKVKDDPSSPANRRITLKMKFGVAKKVDLGKDPSALDDIDSLSKTPTPEPSKDTATSLTAEKILNSSPDVSSAFVKEATEGEGTKGGESGLKIEVDTPVARKPSDPIPIPEPSESDTPIGMPRDKIFGDFPIISPGFSSTK